VESVLVTALPEIIEALALRTYELVHEQGGNVPLLVLRELAGNLLHAGFTGVVISILDGGNTVRFSDRGPGIADKRLAQRRGFTTADEGGRRYLRGVGAGLSLVREQVEALEGRLEIDDNLDGGTVVTIRVPPPAPPPEPLAEAALTGLTPRQIQALLLVVELGPVGPTTLAREMRVAVSTAYRDLLGLQAAGMVTTDSEGRRTVTDSALDYLRTLL